MGKCEGDNMGIKENYNGELTCSMSVTDIKKSIEWYKDVLGFELQYHLEDLAWCEFKHPTANIHLGFSQVEKMPPPGGNAVPVWGVKDIETARKELEEKDVRFDGDTQVIPDMVKLATFYDLDDNCFMLAQDISSID